MRLLLLLLISTLTTRADWQGYVKQRADAGADDLTIRKELVRPSRLATTNTVEVAKDPARVEMEQAAAAAASALVAIVAPQVPAEQRLERVAALKAKQMRDLIRQALPNLTVAQQREVQYLVAELQAYYAAAPDMWPPAADFGQATKRVPVVTYEAGPSRFDILRGADEPADPPSLDAIRAAMRGAP